MGAGTASAMRWVGAVLVALLTMPPAASRGLQYQHDELLWTKQNWQGYKLDFPWSSALKERDTESSRQLHGPLYGFPSNSLNGPLMDAEEIVARVEEDAQRGSGLQTSTLDVSLLDDEAHLDAAVGIVQCKVCGVLVRRLWEGLARWVDVKHQVPNKNHILAYAEELCEFEVTNEVLKGWVLLRARVAQGEGLPFELEGETQEFYMLSKRAKQRATPSEIQVVRRACQKLLHENEGGKEKPQVLYQASTLLHKYYQLMAQRLNKWQDANHPEVVEAVDDGPHAQRQCFNRHPQCELWRDEGECERNPEYMLGDEGTTSGWCHAACRGCQEAAVERYHGLQEGDAEYLQIAFADLLTVFQSKACASAAPCKWAAGEGMQQLLATAKAGADRSFAGLIDQAEFIGGPVLSKQQQLEMALDHTKLKKSRPMLSRELTDAVVPDMGRTKRSTQPPEPFLSKAGTALWEELGAKCVYVSTGFWMYEVCYMHHINQLHVTETQYIDWVISLGAYELGSANWTLTNTSMSSLYPHFTKVPFVSQFYNSGNHCELDPDETGTQRSMLRSTELRLMCSPDADLHIIIKEPQQCSYLVELYVPQLCTLPGFQVELPDSLVSHIDFILATDRHKASPHTAGGSRQGSISGGNEGGEEEEEEEALDPMYALSETDIDEYADPDELEQETFTAEGTEGTGLTKGQQEDEHDEL